MYILRLQRLQAIFTWKCCLFIPVPYDKHMDVKKNALPCLANLLDQLLLKTPKNHQKKVMVLWILSDVMTSDASKLPSGLNLLASAGLQHAYPPHTHPKKKQKAFPEIDKNYKSASAFSCSSSKDSPSPSTFFHRFAKPIWAPSHSN